MSFTPLSGILPSQQKEVSVAASFQELSFRPEATLELLSPRGFCAGVERAIKIVEHLLEKHGGPIYVRHEIVHNKVVVQDLEKKGAVFVPELSDMPKTDRPIVFSAHGVAKTVILNAESEGRAYIDATCPLVSKVHSEAIRAHKKGFHVLLIGHYNHPEVIGTMGQLPPGAIHLITNLKEAKDFLVDPDCSYFCITQTTLSIDDTASILNCLKERIPQLTTPRSKDICYATTNRQKAVKEVAPSCDLFLVIGSSNSSNSSRLQELAEQTTVFHKAILFDHEERIPWEDIFVVFQTFIQSPLSQQRPFTLGLTAGASAPERTVQSVIQALKQVFTLSSNDRVVINENVSFKLPSI